MPRSCNFSFFAYLGIKNASKINFKAGSTWPSLGKTDNITVFFYYYYYFKIGGEAFATMTKEKLPYKKWAKKNNDWVNVGKTNSNKWHNCSYELPIWKCQFHAFPKSKIWG